MNSIIFHNIDNSHLVSAFPAYKATSTKGNPQKNTQKTHASIITHFRG